MEVIDLEIPDVKLIKPRVYSDDRGNFSQTFHAEQYANIGIDIDFVQDNRSISKKCVVRGMHYQLKHPQAKLVSVPFGKVFDVVVDLRKSSPYFMRWVGFELSSENGYQLFIPKGFGHGFQVLSDEAVFDYKCDALYSPGDEYALNWLDASVGIKWPIVQGAILSEKDRLAPLLNRIPEEHLFY